VKAAHGIRSALRGWAAAILTGAGVVALIAAAVGALLSGEFAAAAAYLGVGLGVAGLALAALQSVRIARDTRARVDTALTEGRLARLAIRSVVGEVGATNRLVKRLSAAGESGLRLAHSGGAALAAGQAGVDRGLLTAILGLAPQRAIIAGADDAVAAYSAAMAEASPTTKLLTLPAPEHQGMFFERLAAEGRSRRAPAPVIVAIGETAVHEVLWTDTAMIALERLRVDELLVLSSTGPRAARGAPDDAGVRVTPVGPFAVIVARRST
jgi:hypothetical protein